MNSQLNDIVFVWEIFYCASEGWKAWSAEGFLVQNPNSPTALFLNNFPPLSTVISQGDAAIPTRRRSAAALVVHFHIVSLQVAQRFYLRPQLHNARLLVCQWELHEQRLLCFVLWDYVKAKLTSFQVNSIGTSILRSVCYALKFAHRFFGAILSSPSQVLSAHSQLSQHVAFGLVSPLAS